MLRLVGLVLSSLLLACETPAEPQPAGGASVPTLLGDAPGIMFIGNWTSTSCGGRAYARNVRFEADGSYAGVDLISPCPPGTTCVWSGIVAYGGSWVQNGTLLQLRETGGGPTGPGTPHPTELRADTEGQLREGDCAYTRGLTVPGGYTEDQVTPRVPGLPAK